MPFRINDENELIRRHYKPERRSAIRVKGAIYRKMNMEVDLKLAETREEFETAFRIIHDSYVEQGYMKPTPSGLRITKYNALPSTLVIVAREDRKIVATISLIMDSLLGLPSEDIFPEEVRKIRESALRIAEVAGLAISHTCRNERIIMNLYHVMIAFAEFCGVTRLVISVNPRHAKFYKDVCMFDEASDVRMYKHLDGDAPAVLLINRYPEVKRELINARTRFWDDYDADLFSFFFSRNIVVDNTAFWNRTPMDPDTLRYFFLEKTDIFRKLSRDELKKIASYYPYFDLKWMFDTV